jgi:hypothetical protein
MRSKPELRAAAFARGRVDSSPLCSGARSWAQQRRLETISQQEQAVL